MLRKAGEGSSEFTRRITLSDLGTSTPVAQDRKGATGMTMVTVTRASTRQEYSVPIEGAQMHAAHAGGR
jgi:hypothetical protein